MIDPSPFVMVSSPLMHDLAVAIIKRLAESDMDMRMPHHEIKYTQFANGEFLPILPETVRRQHVFLLHAMQWPDPNQQIFKLLLTCDAMQRASVDRITLVLPFIPYMRQDRKDRPRVPISARMVADLLEMRNSVKQIITIDLHAEQEQGFFSEPVDNIFGWHIFSDHILKRFGGNLENIVLVAADFGATVRTYRLDIDLGDTPRDRPVRIYEKKRTSPNQSEIVSALGEDVKGKRVIIYEDMIDTGGTLRAVVNALIKMEASEVYVYATHAIFSKDSENLFAQENINVVTTDSIPRTREYYEKHKNWLTKISLAEYLSKTIFESTLIGGSVSKLHGRKKVK